MKREKEKRRTFSVATFNGRGLKEEFKKNCLTEDVDSYKIDVLCIQESKCDKTDCNIGRNRLILFKSVSHHYGNGFVISKKWSENIHRTWRVTDRIAVLQLKTRDQQQQQYTCQEEDGDNLRYNFIIKVSYHSKLITKRVKCSYNTCRRITDTRILFRKDKKRHRNRETAEATSFYRKREAANNDYQRICPTLRYRE